MAWRSHILNQPGLVATDDPQVVLESDVVGLEAGQQVLDPGLCLGINQRLWKLEIDLFNELLHSKVAEGGPSRDGPCRQECSA